ncbi:MAG: hypothetical protein MJ062_03300 [Oscillospiraceae bacterium]|nr:hypothetical protein [Oscillospiraceae bacterium]
MAGGNFGGGSGTQADPFIVEDWADIIAIGSATNFYYYKVLNDLDANDRNNGVWSELTIQRFTEIDFDGHKIRNIYTDASVNIFKFYNGSGSGWRAQSIKNLVIENLYAPNATLFSAGTTLTISDSTITGAMRYLAAQGYTNDNNFLRCSIAITGGAIDYSTYTVGLKQCSIKITDGNGFTKSSRLRQCRVTGNIKQHDEWLLVQNMINSVFAVKDDTGGQIERASFTGGDAAFPSLIDVSLLGDYTPIIDSGIAATTAQANNLAWLQEHGFAVVSAV